MLKDFGLRYGSRVGVACSGSSCPCLVAGCLWPEGRGHTFETVAEHFANPNLSVVVAMLDFRVCFVRQNYVFSHYRTSDLDDWIFHCLLA